MTLPTGPWRLRWYGDADVEQPDVGDVLVIAWSQPETYLLVHAARRVRGRRPEDLWLTVTYAQAGTEGALPAEVCERQDGGGAVFPCSPPTRSRRDRP